MRFAASLFFAAFSCINLFSFALHAEEVRDELMLGTWKATGISETECFVSDATITLRIFEKVKPGQFRATHVERGILAVKEECREQFETDPGERVPVELGGGVVTVDIDGTKAMIWSEDPDFHTEVLEIQGPRMLGIDDMGAVEYVKAFPEFRYDAREVMVGWRAIQYPLREMEQTALDVISEYSLSLTLLGSYFSWIIEAIVEASAGDEPGGRGIERRVEKNHLDRFDGMTVDEIFDSALPDVSEYLKKKIASAQRDLAECEECSEDKLLELREILAEREEQRNAILEVQAGRQ